MNKNLKKVTLLSILTITISASTVACALGNWTSEVSVQTPNWGKALEVRSAYDGKDTNSANGSIYATYQKTSLKHQVCLAYQNVNKGLSEGSTWATMEVDVIKRPELKVIELFRAYYTMAKSHNLEPTNNTLIKYKFSADSL